MAKDTTAESQAAKQPNLSEKTTESSGAPESPGRRRFIAGLGAATAAVSSGVLVPLVASSANARETTQTGFDSGAASTAVPAGVTNNRIAQAFNLRVGEATQDALAGPAVNLN